MGILKKFIHKIKIIFFTAVLGMMATLSVAQHSTFPIGEKVSYNIKNLGIKSGEASITYEGPTTIKGRDVILIVFVSDAFNFYDEEKLYLDPETFCPVVVQRDLNIFGKKEKIEEEYFHDQGQIKITKHAGGKVSTQVIEKKGPIDNIYGFIYRYRQDGKFQIGEELSLNLPTKDVTVKLIKRKKMRVAGEVRNTYYMEDDSRDFRVWFDDGPEKIPVRIDGAMGLTKASLILREYE